MDNRPVGRMRFIQALEQVNASIHHSIIHKVDSILIQLLLLFVKIAEHIRTSLSHAKQEHHCHK